MLRELDAIFAAVPHDQLALQWDTRLEFAILEGISPAWFQGTRAGVLERLLRVSRGVPADVELGFHLCYGDDYHGHFVVPDDTAQARRGRQRARDGAVPPAELDPHARPGRRPRRSTSRRCGSCACDPQDRAVSRRAAPAGRQGRARAGGSAARAATCRASASPPTAGGGAAARRPSTSCSSCTARPATASTCRGAKTAFAWPAGFDRIPDEEWTRAPLSDAGLAYDHVDEHGWYDNLNPSVTQLAAHLQDGDILVDYSGGTGILLDRLRLRIFDRAVGTIVVDASAKFLRVAHEKYKDDPRFAARLLRFIKEEKRLQSLDEVLGPELLERGVDAIAAVNAIHLYPDLDEVASAWVRALKPGGKVFINSGNLRNPSAKPGEWILDETVWVINDLAESLVRSDPEYAQYRAVLDDTTAAAGASRAPRPRVHASAPAGALHGRARRATG